MHPPKKKREPLLADLVLALPDSFERIPEVQDLSRGQRAEVRLHPFVKSMVEWEKDFRLKLRVAKRFVLDDEAVRYLARAIWDNPRLVADAQDFAIAPYRWMWIEYSQSVMLKSLGNDIVGDSNSRAGILVDGPRVRSVFVVDGLDAFVPFEYILHRPMSEVERREYAAAVGIDPHGSQIDFELWGELTAKITGQDEILEGDDDSGWDKGTLCALSGSHTVVPAPWLKFVGSDERARHYPGMMRDIIALLLFLNRTRDVQYIQDFPHSQGFVNKKLRPLVAHSVISMSVNPKDRFVTLTAGEGVKRRLHDVRGHFCHDKQARAGCLHGEQLMHDFGDWWEEYQPLKWKCKGCGGLRWWRREHKRGHHEDGLVFQQYAVTA